MQLTITHFTDPACPFAFSAGPTRYWLRWRYGDQIGWQDRMIVLTLTAPSYEIADGVGSEISIPGFNPVEVYENIAPELDPRDVPAAVEDVLAWAGEPLATAEVAVVARLELPFARAAPARVARPIPAGADFY